MEFASTYFEGEEREGFYVQPLMKRVWAAQLEVLQEIDRICKRHNIKYFAEWGTLLGAVRHKGYIPWDDDIDIGMLRKDFVRFYHYAQKELTKGCFVRNIDDERYRGLLPCVMNSDWILPENKEFLERFHGCPYNVGVDIYCLDNLPKNKAEEEVMVDWFRVARCLGQNWDSEEKTMEEKAELVRQLEEQTKFHFDEKVSLEWQLIQLADKISAMYFDEEAEEVTMMTVMVDQEDPGYRLPVSCYENVVEVPFENTTIPIPTGYDRILRQRYGDDYMTPIRDYDNGDHKYPHFKGKVEELRDAYKSRGMELPEGFDWKEQEETG